MQNTPVMATTKIFRLFIVALFFFLSVKTYSQTDISGRTVNEITKQSLPYVSIGIKGKVIGTVSDSSGYYRLSYRKDEISGTDSIFFSAVGYETVKMSFERYLNADKIILLKELPLLLKTVQVSAKPRKMKSYGRWSASLVFFPAMYKTIPRYSDEKGREQATILKTDPDIFIRKLNFLINRRNFRQIKLRFNIYGVKNGLPAQSLLSRDVVFDVAGSTAIGMPRAESIDLRPYAIELKGHKEIAVSLAILDIQPLPGDSVGQAFYVPSFPNPLRSSFYRMKSEAPWQKVAQSHLLVGIEVSSAKADKGDDRDQNNGN